MRKRGERHLGLVDMGQLQEEQAKQAMQIQEELIKSVQEMVKSCSNVIVLGVENGQVTQLAALNIYDRLGIMGALAEGQHHILAGIPVEE